MHPGTDRPWFSICLVPAVAALAGYPGGTHTGIALLKFQPQQTRPPDSVPKPASGKKAGH
ncbi:MAG TPA: hypothetical protein VNY05_16925 [Candidatus Acidoferrales bacterium]|jgi:hypothetical protein|nr:hypothetical protein [Candidatus Acidoferrales bacterium]